MDGAAGARALIQGQDIYVSTVRPVDRVSIGGAPMVFVGYGVFAPERGWDDFKGVDLHGKVAVFLVNDPDFEAQPGEAVAGKFGGKAMTYYGRWTYKYEEAARRGAVCALIVHETPGAGYGWSTVTGAPGRGLRRGARRGRSPAGAAPGLAAARRRRGAVPPGGRRLRRPEGARAQPRLPPGRPGRPVQRRGPGRP